MITTGVLTYHLPPQTGDQLENIQASIKPGKYGTNPWGGPARARVRGTDAR